MQIRAFTVLLAKSAALLTFLHGCRCRSSKCPSPTPPLNGRVVYRNSESSYVMYKCDPGYVLLGSRSSLCMLGRWSPETPSCVLRADAHEGAVLKIPVQVDQPSSAASQPNVTSTPCLLRKKKSDGAEVKRRSLSRHRPLGVSANRNCSLPPLIGKGYIIVSRFHPNEVTYVCERGYRLSKQRKMYCENGTWTETPPQCLDDNGQGAPLDPELAELENFCERNFGGCEQLCYFGGRTRSCGCSYGYQQNGTRCQDINECETRKPDCQHGCVNTPGSYHCACPTGFETSRDGRSCIDINECAAENGGCTERCENSIGSFNCSCVSRGYVLAADRKTCIPQTQVFRGYCAYNNGGCSHQCRSGMHEAICDCPEGYKLSQGGKKCEVKTFWRQDYCRRNNGGCSHICRSGTHEAICDCPNGYKLSQDGKHCEDIDECAVENGGCMERCRNTFGSFICNCDTWGYSLAADGKTCVPQTKGTTDFCGHNNGGCSHICRSGEHEAICECPNGYELSQDRKNCKDIDECYYRLAKCQHRCINKLGSYECKCHPGYAISPLNKEQCTDIDECENNNFGCAHVCVNMHGSARCYCKPGFSLQEDGKSCADINECASLENRKKCPYGCRNTEGGYECVKNNTGSVDSSFPPEDEEEGSGFYDGTPFDYKEENFIPLRNETCPEGYVGSPSGCRDIDECAMWASTCTGLCVNTPGGFYCVCPAGFSLGKDGRSCNECPNDTYQSGASDQCEKCPPNSHTTGPGKVSINDCICNPGYRTGIHSSQPCQDIDECQTKANNCTDKCINTPGGFHCACHAGYKLADDRTSCDDINECANGRHHCPERCVNTPGSFQCSCNPGRIPRGYTGGYKYQCQDCPMGTYKNEELDQCERCPANSHTLQPASTSKKDCICDRGYRGRPGDGVRCLDIDECAEKTLHCSHECVNIIGSAFCSCPLGQRLKPDNLTCEDIDECIENSRVCSQLCTNTYGSYVCSCNPGYTLSSNDSYQCIDNDECATGNHGCSHMCVNFDGGYYCKCPEGFQMTADLRTCARVTCPMFIDVPNSVTKCNHTRVDSSAPIGTQCTVHCNAGFELEGRGATVCSKNGTWTTELPTCKPLYCPPIQRPEHGDVLPERCLQSNANYFKSRCYFQCDEGYKLAGFPVTTCLKNDSADTRGQGKGTALAWRRIPASCEKETPPVRITCPSSTTFVLPLGQSSMEPDMPPPTTNVEEENVEMLVDDQYYENGTPLPYGDVKVTYVATRPETNESAQCTFEVTIDDKEPPQVLRCPTTVSAVASSLEGVTVTWEEPEFRDNVELQAVERSKESGSLFNTGLHIIYYTAKDTAGNEAVCKFQVNVTRNECRLPDDIEHGSTECHPWLQGVVCEPSCDDGYALPNNVSLFYTCDLAGVWEPRSWIPHCQAYSVSPPTGCLPGSEYFDELNGETDVCVECPPGMYWAQDVAQCFLCEQGFYQDQPAQSSCKPCPANATAVPVLSPVLEQQCFS